MKLVKKTTASSKRRDGSALILAVVLTSLLAIVGILFVMSGRVEKITASNLSDRRDLDLAVETVIARIIDQLTLDVPGMPGPYDDEYYDYPDPCDPWLASLEPYYDVVNSIHRWSQISNIFPVALANIDVPIDIVSSDDPAQNLVPADSDGDGFSDSIWYVLDDMTSSKGRPIYVAVRIVDNAAMLNINTGRRFDPTTTDGSSLLDISLEGLVSLMSTNPDLFENIDVGRGLPAVPADANLAAYETGSIWAFDSPAPEFSPFDIADELMLRNRYMLKHADIRTRLQAVWPRTFDMGGGAAKTVPYELSTDIGAWFDKVSADTALGDYTPRHIATIHSMDRVMAPDGGKMVNVNTAATTAPPQISPLRGMIENSLGNVVVSEKKRIAAQMTANLIDYIDNDSNVTVVRDTFDDSAHYGFERPCIYITELVHRVIPGTSGTAQGYAIELYKPYPEDPDPVGWSLVIRNSVSDVVRPITWTGNAQYKTTMWAETSGIFSGWDPNDDPNDPNDPNEPVDPNDPNDPNAVGDPNQNTTSIVIFSDTVIFENNSYVELRRPVVDPNVPDANVVVDMVRVPAGIHVPSSIGIRSLQRDMTRHRNIQRLWDPSAPDPNMTLSLPNGYRAAGDPNIQAHPLNELFTNIGEIGMIFSAPAYYAPAPVDPWATDTGVIGYRPDADTEAEVRVNLADPNYRYLFNRLTVIDPCTYGHPYAEVRVPGRININTAPWYVIAQLPWMTPYEIAHEVVAYRDRRQVRTFDHSLVPGRPGFGSIVEMLDVQGMRYHEMDPGDLDALPDLTPSDGEAGDFEERDAIFARISNLVTVRSDVFTAYILVRIGENGPQRRMVAILDRSGVDQTGGKVKIRALHPAHDPR